MLMLLKTLLCMLSDAHDSLSFLSSGLSAVAGVALDNAGETEVEGGEPGCSCSPDPNPASRLWGVRRNCQVRIIETYLNAFAEVADSFSFC
jgi:hypothetical protein